MQDIRDYGAVGDGQALDTAAIQKAIDAGGMVLVPPGIYRTGTLYLKSNGGLHLEPGAVLLASHCRQDYNADDFCPQNDVFWEEKVTGAHLITSVGQENVTVEGHGTIDGDGHFWMNESHLIPGTQEYDANPERPGQLLFFCECRDVHVTDVRICNGSYWHLFFHGCRDVFVRGVAIRGDRPRWTNDGIDIDCCTGVTVSDCIIDVGDDGITLRGYGNPLLHKDAVCENVVITNCVIRADRDYGIRIGVGSGLIRNCTLSNLDIEAPNCGGLGIMGRWSSLSRSATSVENLLFTNLRIRARRPLELVSGYGDAPLPNPCRLHNLILSHLLLSPTEKLQITGMPACPLEQIVLNDVTVVLPPEGLPGPVTQVDWVHGLTVDGYRVLGPAEQEITVSHSRDVSVNGVRL